jgi:hypothetical protein
MKDRCLYTNAKLSALGTTLGKTPGKNYLVSIP